jgi:hypothetical protein
VEPGVERSGARNQNRAVDAAERHHNFPISAIVAPLRGLCWFRLATAGCATLHPRLFKGDRYAVAMLTTFYPYYRGYAKVTATRS